MSKTTMRKKVRKYNTFRMLAATVFLIFITVGVLYSVQEYNSPNLIGKWQSLETGEVVEFTKEGQVILKEVAYTPEYKTLNNHQMAYSIDDKKFMMSYEIDGRNLKWGIEGQELETFKRK